jgi:deoxyribose-phosphate aldolase
MASSEGAAIAPPAEKPANSANSSAEEITIMTDRYTNEEWAQQIAETQRVVMEKLGTKRKYDAPTPGSRAFAETIDHTLLKLDATPTQIDALCSEARTEGFKVCTVFWSRSQSFLQ